MPRNDVLKGDLAALNAAEGSAGYEKTSFVASLLQSAVPYHLLIPSSANPPSEATEDEVNEFLEALKQVCLTYIDPVDLDRTRALPDGFLSEFRKLKAFAIKVPRAYGGLGFNQSQYNRILIWLGGFSDDLVALVSAHNSIGVSGPVKKWGTPEQKERFLKGQAWGDISGFAITTSEGGCNVTLSTIHAVRTYSANGNLIGYALFGRSRYTTNASIANNLIVIARTIDEEKLHELNDPTAKKHFIALVVSMKHPGIRVAMRREFSGFGGMYNGDVEFSGSPISIEDRLGDDLLEKRSDGRKPKSGHHVALSILEGGRLSVGAASVGGMKLAFDIALWWALERKQWGTFKNPHALIPIIDHELIAEKIARIASRLYAFEAMVNLAARLYDENKDVRLEAAIVKVLGSQWAREAIDETVQIRGGRGIETGASLEAGGESKQLGILCVKLESSKAPQIFEGTNEILTLWIAKGGLAAYLAQKQKMPIVQFVPWLLYRLYRRPFLYGKNIKKVGRISPRLKDHLRFVERASVDLTRVAIEAMMVCRNKLMDMHTLLAKIVEKATLLDAMTAACLRATKNVAHDDDIHVDLADYFCIETRKELYPPNGLVGTEKPLFARAILQIVMPSNRMRAEILDDPAQMPRARLIERIKNGEAEFLLDGISPITKRM